MENKLKKLRQMNNLTQEQAAEMFGVKTRTWQSWEYGTRNIPEGKREQIISALEHKSGKYYKPDNVMWGVVYTVRRGSLEQNRAIFHREKGEIIFLLKALTKQTFDVVTNVSIYKLTFVRPISAFDIITEKNLNKLVEKAEIVDIPENNLPEVEEQYDFTKIPPVVTLKWERVDCYHLMQS